MIILDIVGGLLVAPALVVLGFWLGLRRAQGQPLAAARSAKAIGGTHRLVKVFTQDTYGLSEGWYYKCSCGRQQPVYQSSSANRYDSTEAKALKAWKAHAGLYIDTPGEATAEQAEIERLRKELKDQQEKCFCKDL